jgi:hypothetical protein
VRGVRGRWLDGGEHVLRSGVSLLGMGGWMILWGLACPLSLDAWERVVQHTTLDG